MFCMVALKIFEEFGCDVCVCIANVESVGGGNGCIGGIILGMMVFFKI